MKSDNSWLSMESVIMGNWVGQNLFYRVHRGIEGLYV